MRVQQHGATLSISYKFSNILSTSMANEFIIHQLYALMVQGRIKLIQAERTIT